MAVDLRVIPGGPPVFGRAHVGVGTVRGAHPGHLAVEHGLPFAADLLVPAAAVTGPAPGR